MSNLAKILTDRAPAAIGPYSQAIRTGNLIFTSGQIPLDRNGEIAGTDIRTQARQVMENLGFILQEAGASFDTVIKTTCYLQDMANFAAFNEVYAEYFRNSPARSCIAVRTLPKQVLCEVEAVAVAD